jgi:murein L,D-transpeptidase YafK
VTRALNWLFATFFLVSLSSCVDLFPITYKGEPVTSIEVYKAERKMLLLRGNKVLRKFDIALGFGPRGHKVFEGDGRTPEGLYYITHRQPQSRFHLSLGISYPNVKDKANAAAQGKEPGGEIFIHGRNKYRYKNYGDWTAGCIAVTDREMDFIYASVNPKTPIIIYP